MRLTRAAAYAVHALSHLAAAGNGRPVTAREVARACGIPQSFGLTVLLALSAAGLLASRPGPGGGYRLARPLAHITLLDVLEAVDGPLDGRCTPPESADPGFDRWVEGVSRRAAAVVRRRLAKVRLSELAGGR